ncbi:MAG: SDR family NAD(P)-dependent oxidoreductase, partial [Phenylobacterium sp.]
MAVVTGASGGLGEHFARLLAGEGAAVAVMARRVEKVEALAAELTGAGHRTMALKLDVADADAIGPALDAVEAAL